MKNCAQKGAEGTRFAMPDLKILTLTEKVEGTLQSPRSENRLLVAYGRTQHAVSLQAGGEKENDNENGKLPTPSASLVPPVSGGQPVTAC